MVFVLRFHYINAHISCISAVLSHFDAGLSFVTPFGRWNKAGGIVLRQEPRSLCLFHLSSCTASTIMRACLSQPRWFQRRLQATWSTAESLQQKPASICQPLAKLRSQIRVSKLSSQAQFGSSLGPVDMWEINVHCFSFWGFVGSFSCCCYTTKATWYLIPCVISLGRIVGVGTHRLVGAWVARRSTVPYEQFTVSVFISLVLLVGALACIQSDFQIRFVILEVFLADR